MSKKLEQLKHRRAQLDAQIRAAAARAKEQERKDRTRSLILLGSALNEFLRRNPEARTALLARLLPFIAERDRAFVSRFFDPHRNT